MKPTLITLCERGLLLQPWSTATTQVTNSRMAPTATILAAWSVPSPTSKL